MAWLLLLINDYGQARAARGVKASTIYRESVRLRLFAAWLLRRGVMNIHAVAITRRVYAGSPCLVGGIGSVLRRGRRTASADERIRLLTWGHSNFRENAHHNLLRSYQAVEETSLIALPRRSENALCKKDRGHY
ncbi:MAG TPA: hypothetical protein VLC46_27830 [Thermoanaerobaculia bacterium]|nr:hypothetical protein [Thermoanaerobaculia bacterium]